MTNLTLRSFQRRFVTAVHSPDIDTAVLSTPRGAGKSWLAGRLVASSLTPGRRLFVRDSETILTASSLDQARFVFRFAKAMLGQKIAIGIWTVRSGSRSLTSTATPACGSCRAMGNER